MSMLCILSWSFCGRVEFANHEGERFHIYEYCRLIKVVGGRRRLLAICVGTDTRDFIMATADLVSNVLSCWSKCVTLEERL